MVSKASEDLPEPDRPVNTTNWSRGMATSIFLRLCSRAPRIVIWRVSLRAGLLLRSAMGRAMRPVTGPVMRPVAGPGHGTWSWDLSGKDAPTAPRNAGPLGPARRNVVRTMPFCQYATAIAVENCQQKRPARGRPFCSGFAQPWRRIGALPELIVHAEPDDVDLVACCRARSADRGATGGIAKIGIKIFDLRRPGSENCVFDAEARGPAGPI